MLQTLARRAALILFLIEGCDPAGSLLPAGAEPFVPPRVYEQWWQLTEECSGLTSSFAAVNWYRVPGVADIALGDGTLVGGEWDERPNRIVLAGNEELAGDLVRHEMLHALLQAPGHPREDFISRCAGTVICTELCIKDAGPAPQPNPSAITVSPSALEIGVEVSPSAPSSSINDGNFMMVITARNPSSSPVIVQLPPSGDASPPVSFSYNLVSGSRGWSYDMRAEVPEDTWFAPSEEKHFIFDFHIGSGDSRYEKPPGTYQFNGAYGRVWAPNAPTVVVSP